MKRIDALEGITRIRAGWGWAAAVRDEGVASSIYSWGVNSSHGRLGVGTSPVAARVPGASAPSLPTVPHHVYEPTRLALPLMEMGIVESRWALGEVECGEDALWLTVAESEPQ